jgi:hypothetical protein
LLVIVTLEGDVREDNPGVIGGIRGNYYDEKLDKVVSFSMSSKSYQDMLDDLPTNVLYQAAANGSLDRTPNTNIQMPVMNPDGAVGVSNVKVYARGEDVYKSDLLRDQLANTANLTIKEESDIRKELLKLRNNPELDTFEGRKAVPYNANTNEILRYSDGSVMSYDDILEMNQIKKQQ